MRYVLILLLFVSCRLPQACFTTAVEYSPRKIVPVESEIISVKCCHDIYFDAGCSTPYNSLQWTFETKDCEKGFSISGDEKTAFMWKTPGTFHVTLKIKDTHGNTDTKIIIVFVED